MTDLRQKSWDSLAAFGIEPYAGLPAMDPITETRTAAEVRARLVCLNVVVASAYGFPRDKARAWLRRSQLSGATSPQEAAFLGGEQPGYAAAAREQVEALWALAWIGQLHDALPIDSVLPDDAIMVLPNLKHVQSSDDWDAPISARAASEALDLADLYYCLHWSLVEGRRSGRVRRGLVPEHVARERRRALEWFLYPQHWDEVALDT